MDRSQIVAAARAVAASLALQPPSSEALLRRKVLETMAELPEVPKTGTAKQFKEHALLRAEFHVALRRAVYTVLGRALVTVRGGYRLVDPDDSAPAVVDGLCKHVERKTKTAQRLVRSSSEGLTADGRVRKDRALDNMRLLRALSRRSEQFDIEDVPPAKGAPVPPVWLEPKG